jgi:methylated-DNA-[protein]-cysteine S-methyltransferase
VYFTYCDSPIGKLLLAGDAQALRIISLPNDRHHLVPADDWQQSDDALHNAVEHGTTVSYGELAQRLEKPTATRAVGAANGANPIPIVIPCHRVIGANGSLTGFGGGLDAKRWLLEHEHALPESARQRELWA